MIIAARRCIGLNLMVSPVFPSLAPLLLAHRLANSSPGTLIRLVSLLQRLDCTPIEQWASKLAEELAAGLVNDLSRMVISPARVRSGSDAGSSSSRGGSSSSMSSVKVGRKDGIPGSNNAPSPNELVAALAALESYGVLPNATLDAAAAAYLGILEERGTAA